MKQYQEQEVVYQLGKKADLKIEGRVIQELKRNPGEGGIAAKGDVGIGSKGKIDFLCKYKGYNHYYVDKF